MPTKWFHSSINSIEDLSPTTKVFTLELEADQSFDFLAGQFITLDLPIGEKRLERWRSYSIANPPNETNQLELCIVRTDPGHATKYLFEEATVGTKIKFKGPLGAFCLPQKPAHELIMICTGTGVAPFRSMLLNAYASKTPGFKSAHLIFGTRNHAGVLYKQEFDELQETHQNFNYSVALSRAEYKGYQGYVHPIYMDQYEKVNEQRLFYLCGWQNMVDMANKNLLNLGYQPSQIIQELYG